MACASASWGQAWWRPLCRSAAGEAVIHVAPMSHGAAAILCNLLKKRGSMLDYVRHEKGPRRALSL
jgi:hypothetical protein